MGQSVLECDCLFRSTLSHGDATQNSIGGKKVAGVAGP